MKLDEKDVKETVKNVITSLTADGVTMLIKGGIEIAVDLLNTTSSMSAVENKLKEVYGEQNAAQMKEFSSRANEAYGLNQHEAERYAANFGAVLKEAGVNPSDYLGEIKGLVGLTGDLAAYKMIGHDQAFEEVLSGIVAGSDDILTGMADYMEGNLDKQGYFQRTAESFAAELTILQNNIDSIKRSVCEGIEPAVTGAASWFNGWFEEPEKSEQQVDVEETAANMKSSAERIQSIRWGYYDQAAEVNRKYDEAEKLVGDYVAALIPNDQEALREITNRLSAIDEKYGELRDPESGALRSDAILDMIRMDRNIELQEALELAISLMERERNAIQNDMNALETERQKAEDLQGEEKTRKVTLAQVREDIRRDVDNADMAQRYNESSDAVYKRLQDYIQKFEEIYGGIPTAILRNMENHDGTNAEMIVDGRGRLKEYQEGMDLEAYRLNLRMLGEELVAYLSTEIDETNTAIDSAKRTEEAASKAIDEQGAALAAIDQSISGMKGNMSDLAQNASGASAALYGLRYAVNRAKATMFLPVEYDGSHATGLDRVPYDNYLARLHVGEAVLTASEAQKWRAGESKGGGVSAEQLAAAMEPVVESIRNIRIALDVDGREFASNQAAHNRTALNRYNTQIARGMGK